MTTDRFTPSQREAIETLDRSCVVTAGPGAGKTRVLVERVLNILRRGRADLDQIVAITFTNKAAHEMKERIRRSLMELADSATQPQEARRWVDLQRRLKDAAISTIHGFCASVLRAQPVEAQVDPQVAILDEYRSRLLLVETVREIVSDLADEGNDIAARLIIGYSRRGLIEALVRLYTTTRTLGYGPDQIEQLTLGSLSTTEEYQESLTTMEEIIQELAHTRGLPAQAKAQVEALDEAWSRYGTLLPKEPQIEDASLFEESLEALKRAKVHKRAKAVKDLAMALENQLKQLDLIFYDVCGREVVLTLIRTLDQIDRRYQEAKGERNGLDYEDLQLKVRNLFRTHSQLARKYAARYQFVLVDEFQDTNGLQKEILDLLVQSSKSGVLLPESGGENHESEGKNEQPASSDRRPATNLFIVGDGKQSVYNFRGAAVEVFAEAARELEEQGANPIGLEKNFRSTRSLIRFFNEFFSRLMSLEQGQEESFMRMLGYVEFMPSQSDRPESPHPPVELLLEVGDHIESAEQGREWEAERVAGRIAEMVQGKECLVANRTGEGEGGYRPVRYGDMAILFRAMTDIKVYERALRKRSIPYHVIAGRGFYQREEVQDVISLLAFLENRTDEIALVSALRSSLFGLSDETLYWLRQFGGTRTEGKVDYHPLLDCLLSGGAVERLSEHQRPLVEKARQILARLLEERNRISLAELLEEILALTQFEAIQATFYDGHQRSANLRKLLELARSFEASGSHFLRDFIHFVSQFNEMETREGEAPVEGGADDVVHIMTIHKAKGLEFPIVVVPDLARQLRSQVPGLAYDRGLGLGVKVPDRHGELHDTLSRQRVGQMIRWREVFENQRLFFVASTRAMDYLILAGTAAKLSNASKSSKTNQPDSFASPAWLQDASSWLQWVCAILDIQDPETLPRQFVWNGVEFRTGAGGIRTPEDTDAVERIIDRFGGMRQGRVIPPPALPALSEEFQPEYDAIIQRAIPIAIEPAASLRQLSVTSLLSFARCPLQYYYEMVLGLPGIDEYEDGGAFADPFTSSGGFSAAVRGVLVHRFCQEYDGSEDADVLLRRLIQEAVVIGGSDDVNKARDRAIDQLRPMIDHYLESRLWKEIDQILWGGKPGRIESEVEFIYYPGTLPLRGRIDKLVVDGEERVRIIDFKTNRITPEQVESIAREYEFQIRIYALAARRAMGFERLRAELYFLEPDVRYEVDPQRLGEEGTAQEIVGLCRQILAVREFRDAIARPEPERCRRCRCFPFCPSRAL